MIRLASKWQRNWLQLWGVTEAVLRSSSLLDNERESVSAFVHACVCVRESKEDSTVTGSVSSVQLVNLWVVGGNSNQTSWSHPTSWCESRLKPPGVTSAVIDMHTHTFTHTCTQACTRLDMLIHTQKACTIHGHTNNNELHNPQSHPCTHCEAN